MLSYFPRGVLDEILNLIESVFEGFPSYSLLRRITLTTSRLSIFQNWNSILKKEFAPEGANSFSKEPMTIESGSDFKTGKAIKYMNCKINEAESRKNNKIDKIL